MLAAGPQPRDEALLGGTRRSPGSQLELYSLHVGELVRGELRCGAAWGHWAHQFARRYVGVTMRAPGVAVEVPKGGVTADSEGSHESRGSAAEPDGDNVEASVQDSAVVAPMGAGGVDDGDMSRAGEPVPDLSLGRVVQDVGVDMVRPESGHAPMTGPAAIARGLGCCRRGGGWWGAAVGAARYFRRFGLQGSAAVKVMAGAAAVGAVTVTGAAATAGDGAREGPVLAGGEEGLVALQPRRTTPGRLIIVLSVLVGGARTSVQASRVVGVARAGALAGGPASAWRACRLRGKRQTGSPPVGASGRAGTAAGVAAVAVPAIVTAVGAGMPRGSPGD